MLRIPEKHLSVITLCNTSTASLTLAEQVRRCFLGLVRRPRDGDERPRSPPVRCRKALAAGDNGLAPAKRPARAAGGRYYSDELDLPATAHRARRGPGARRAHEADLRFVTLARICSRTAIRCCSAWCRATAVGHGVHAHDESCERSGVRAERVTDRGRILTRRGAGVSPSAPRFGALVGVAASGSSGQSCFGYRPRMSFRTSK